MNDEKEIWSLLSSTRDALRERRRRRSDGKTSVSSSNDGGQASCSELDRARRDGPQAGPSGLPAEVSITPYRDGPYLLRGPFSLKDQDGVEIPNSRRVVALCRCGRSRTRPFCDGTHRLIDFQAPSGLERSSESSVGDGSANED
ncbi:MAG: Iron sulfur, CDGSH-type [Solirubrobacterales bacterium]|nr:Iron sulfur, CDGSH-type [Solirubrobacterales bacterium]